MNLKGDYIPGGKYEPGDVVRYSGMAFVLNKEDDGTLPGMGDSWSRLSQTMWDVVDLILSVMPKKKGGTK